MDQKKTIVIGSGPAGLTAAIYLARANLNPTVFAGSSFGGQLMLTTEVDNFPGFLDGIMGPVLMDNLLKQAKKFGANIIFKDVLRTDFSQKPYRVYTDDQEYSAEGIIIATGASARKLGLPNEAQLTGRGISYCATCDGPFFKSKQIAVIGGGDSAMEESLFLTKFASKVYLIHRRDTFKASAIMQQKVQANPSIEPIYNSEVTMLQGKDKLTGITIRDVTNGQERDLNLDGLFIAIGHNPNTGIFQNQLAMDEHGYIVVTNHTKTNVDGVFSAGDVDDFRYQQAITAAGEGCKAALDLGKYLEGITI